jgi:acyl-CoA reductase-like NAD-dependent aldehyde dehydrogenase
VIGMIMPWNYPVNLPLRTLVPALLAGNAVVWKPSEHAARCGALLDEVTRAAIEASLGAEWCPLVTVVQGGREQGEALVDSGVDHVVFVGSVPTGRAVARRAAARLVPVSLELGSKDPAIVLHDADLARTARGVAWGAFHNAGQDCASVERCYHEQRLLTASVDNFDRINVMLVRAAAAGWYLALGFLYFIAIGVGFNDLLVPAVSLVLSLVYLLGRAPGAVTISPRS